MDNNQEQNPQKNQSESKPLHKPDDSAKAFIIECLDGVKTHGFDIDQIYFYNNRYYVIEYLKCEYGNLSPHYSHPHRYPENWRKFYSLWQIAYRLNGYLLLVNYADDDKITYDGEQRKDLVRILYVTGIKEKELQEAKAYVRKKDDKIWIAYLEVKDFQITKEEYKTFLQKLNNGATNDFGAHAPVEKLIYPLEKPLYPTKR